MIGGIGILNDYANRFFLDSSHAVTLHAVHTLHYNVDFQTGVAESLFHDRVHFWK